MTQIEYSILRSHYPQNTMIILDSSSNSRLCGSVGRIAHINRELGTILVDFEDGQRLSLIYGVDIFHKYTKRSSIPRGDL